MNEIKKLLGKFATDLNRLIAEREKQALAAVRADIMTGLAVGGAKVSPQSVASAIVATQKPRRKGPVQLCPVPNCKNRAAPVFGMVCAKHKDISKAVIKRYRAARAAKKAKA